MMTERITTILESVYARLEPLMPSERFYVALYDSSKNEISFIFLREKDSIRTKESDWFKRPLQKDGVLPDILITRGATMLFEKNFSSRLKGEGLTYWPGTPPQSWLGVPMKVGDNVLGVMVAERASGSFSGSDQRVLTTMSRQTALAIENARLFDTLERKVENLKILNEVGQKLTRGLAKQEDEILSLIYESATKLGIDTYSMYIAFYETAPNKPDTETDIYGNIRFALALDEGKEVRYSNRPVRNGLTEYVIRTKASFNPPDVQTVYREIARDQINRIPLSWLGVPMLSEGQVFGVIVLRHYKQKHAYSRDDQEILEILAGQAAVAIQNLRLYQFVQQEQEKRLAIENMAIMSNVAAEFAHKMNNLAGTIPIRISIVKSLLEDENPRDVKILEQLEKIDNEAVDLLNAAKEIRESSEPRALEDIIINDMIEIAIEKARNNQQTLQNDIEIQKNFGKDLPTIRAERAAFLDTLTSIIKNSIEAVEDRGVINIHTRRILLNNEDGIQITISDTGKGIAQADLPKIFDLFYTTKGERGLGFGLWRDRVFIKKLGGELSVQSEIDEGTTFTISLPLKNQQLGYSL